MSFKDQLANDIEKVFLNDEDFAEEHEIEGTLVTCVLNSDTADKIKDGRILGQIEADAVIFGKASDFPKQRGPESIINVDGREMIVVKWAVSMGMAEIALRQNCTM